MRVRIRSLDQANQNSQNDSSLMKTAEGAVSNTIEFLSVAMGSRLIATCSADKSGRSLGFYTVEVADDLGNPVAKMTATCFRRQPAARK